MKHPQLQLHGWAPDSPSIERFFGVELPAHLERRSEQCRAAGGRFGFQVGNEEWLIDLGWVRVTGGGERTVLEEADDLDAVISVSADALLSLLEGRSQNAGLVLRRGTEDSLAPLLAILGAPP